jgi:hypothetical protein
MEPAGVLIYGYGMEDARLIRSFLEETVGVSVLMISGAGRNRETVLRILQYPAGDLFADEKTKMVMLLGFSEEQINTILRSFPKEDGRFKRPIFCMPTEQNQGWPLEQLLEHLEEERRYWSEKNRTNPS